MIVTEAAAHAPRLEDVLVLIEKMAPVDRVRLREELRVRFDAAGESEGFRASQPHRLRQ
jgi:hypothetical protein